MRYACKRSTSYSEAAVVRVARRLYVCLRFVGTKKECWLVGEHFFSENCFCDACYCRTLYIVQCCYVKHIAIVLWVQRLHEVFDNHTLCFAGFCFTEYLLFPTENSFFCILHLVISRLIFFNKQYSV